MHVCASARDWQGCRLLATGRVLALSYGVRKAMGAFLSGRHLGNDHSKCNHSWKGGGGGGEAERRMRSACFIYLFKVTAIPLCAPLVLSCLAPQPTPCAAPLLARQAEPSSTPNFPGQGRTESPVHVKMSRELHGLFCLEMCLLGRNGATYWQPSQCSGLTHSPLYGRKKNI